MNTEVIKAMNKKEKNIGAFRDWWNKHDYKVMRGVFFPVYFGMKAKRKFSAWLNSREVWSEERINKILNYYIPRASKWDNEDKCFYLFDNGYGWNIGHAKKYLKLKDRRFWHIHGRFGDKIRIYLIEKFELEGFRKEVGDCFDGWMEVTFYLTEKSA